MAHLTLGFAVFFHTATYMGIHVTVTAVEYAMSMT
jgi:hypothetical protein